jgi:hypothetical protein
VTAAWLRTNAFEMDRRRTNFFGERGERLDRLELAPTVR